MAATQPESVTSNTTSPVCLELRPECSKRACVERLAHLAHQVQVVVQVVDGGQHGAQHFAAAVQVVQVGSGETVAPTIVPRNA